MLLLFGFAPAGFAAAAGAEAAALDRAFARLQTYDWSDSHEALNAIELAVVATRNDPARRRELEDRLAAVLTTSAPRAAKAFVCRQLGLVGTSRSVPALAALLADADLSHMARLALERLPRADAAAALRDALPRVNGELKIGIINSLGTLADAEAVTALARLLAGADQPAAAAAARALGKIGTVKAARALEQTSDSASQALRSLITRSYIMAGEQLLQQGQRAEAARIFRKVFEQETGGARLAGFRGLVAAEPGQAVRRLGEALAGDDESLRDLAGEIIAEWPGGKAPNPFLDLLPSLPTAGQVALLDAVHVRCDPAARSAVLAACESPEPGPRLAALRALGVVGNAQDAPRLARLAASESGNEREAARLALVNLPGREPSEAMLKMLPAAKPAIGVELIRALAGRGATEASPALATYLSGSEESLRVAALEALAVLGDEKQVTAIVGCLKSVSGGSAFSTAAKSLEAIVTRAGAACRDALIAGIRNADPGTQIVLLEQLSRVGGSEALRTVRSAVESGNAEVANAAVRALAEWPDAEALADLLKVVQSADQSTPRETALRGYVRLCRELPLPPQERLDRLSEAAKLATNTSEKILIASGLAEVPAAGSLKLLADYLEDPALVDAASVAAVKVASALDAKYKREIIPVLQLVAARCQNADIQKQAKAILQKLESGAN